MSPLILGWIVVATVCLSLAVVQLIVWAQRRSQTSSLFFAAAALAAAGQSLAEIRLSSAASIPDYIAGFKLANYSISILMIALAWFVVGYAGLKQSRLAWAATTGWLVCVAINAVRPTGLALSNVSGLQQIITPWGDSYTLAVAQTDWTKLLADLSTLFILVLSFLACRAVWRGGSKRRALLLATIGSFIAIALAHTTLVDLGVLASPYLISYLFLTIVLVMGYGLATDIASASVLSERVRSEERRWRALMEGVELLVTRVRTDGSIVYVNPYFCRVSGFSEEELLGETIHKVLPEDERDNAQRRLEEVNRGSLEATFESVLETRQDEHRTIVWRNVLFEETGRGGLEVLSVGADVTDQRRAERARDQALEEIATLKSQLEEENLYLKEEIKLERDFSGIIGESEPLRYVLFRIEQVAATDTTVFIQGETGVGKELIARAIHRLSRRSEGPFVRLNCAALPANLVESELFGHVAGAFTDAKGRRTGRFELANGGTLLLDEISELPLDLQPKLLRVLQDGEFESVGSSETKRSDVRVIAATNRNLEEAIESGSFREDLYYRLHVYPITVPPLRDRASDIPLLLEHFLPHISSKIGKPIEEVPASVLRALQAYSWPGNVRQLLNVLEEAVVLSEEGVLRLSERFGSTSGAAVSPPSTLASLADAERDHIRRVLESTDGQIAGRGGAAEILGLHPNTLRSRMKKLGLSAKELAAQGS